MSDKPAISGASFSVQCVHCQAVLKSPAPVPGGKIVKCPKCKKSFTTPGAGTNKPQTTPVVAAPPPADDDGEMEDDVD